MAKTYDTIVTGIGGMGSAALYHLARSGQRVLGLERFEIGHSRGSSHGENRIIRRAYFEGSNYVPLVIRAHQLWQDLSTAAGEKLIFETGSLEMSEPGYDYVERSKASCIDHDLPYELLDESDVHRRFPAFRVAPGTSAIFQPQGGYVLSEAAIQAHARLAVAQGAELRAGETLLDFQPTADGGVTVRTTAGTYHAGQLVLTAGAWMRELVPTLAETLATFKQAIAWFRPRREPDQFRPGAFPVFIHFGDNGEFYGLPMHSDLGFKVGGPHFGREPIDPNVLSRDPSPSQVAAIEAFIERTFPDAIRPARLAVGCIYTKTPDEDFVIDRMPGCAQVLVVSPCSGHGYKFASVVGEIVCDLVTKGSTRHDLSAFMMRRFSAQFL